uniref:Pectinesterase inhibitor domain-containing protein n=2 Tax=Solanum lycopersicum TaxID=4081 RepID=A0A3Q7HJD7_SOLLC
MKMTSLFTPYFLPLVLFATIFNFQTSLCDIRADEALITGICRQVQDLQFCLTTFRQIIPSHPYVPEEVTRAAITKSLQNANDNRAFVEKAQANAKDKETKDLYSICDSSYGLLITVLQDASKSLTNKDYNGLENDLAKCPRFVSDCQNVLGSKTTREMVDRSRKQFDLVLMAKIAEQLIKK